MQADRTNVTCSVVFVGRFNPSDFTVDAFERVKAFAANDLKEVHYERLLPEQLLTVQFGDWARLEIVPERFIFDVYKAPHIRAADVAYKAVREIAPKSIVRSMGINVIAEYKFNDLADRDNLGLRLVPAAAWGDWGKQVAESITKYPSTDPRHGGALTATLREQQPGGRVNGHLDVKIETFDRFGSVFGVRLIANDHYGTPVDKANEPQPEAAAAAILLEQLEEEFDASIKRSLDIFDGILNGSRE